MEKSINIIILVIPISKKMEENDLSKNDKIPLEKILSFYFLFTVIGRVQTFSHYYFLYRKHFHNSPSFFNFFAVSKKNKNTISRGD